MRPAIVLTTILLCSSTVSMLCAQGPTSHPAGLERMIVVVPMIGAGTPDNPSRPLGMPAGEAAQKSLIGYRYVVSDNGRLAIVELTAPSRKHFGPALTTLGTLAQAFDPRLHDRAKVEAALRLIRKDFDLDVFLWGIRLPRGAK